MAALFLWFLALAAAITCACGGAASCTGAVNVSGFGLASIVPTGMGANESAQVRVSDGQVVPELGGRAYFADACNSGAYNHTQYLAFNLLGKTMRFTTDLSGLGCGCNAAFYLTSMTQNEHPSECKDYYCDANNVCGESCAEIDIMEANQHAWHSTLHAQWDHSGLGKGIGGGGAGWSGPRDWTTAQYGPGAQCIDTTKPFEVAVSFPASAACELEAMTVTLSQAGSACPLFVSIGGYPAMGELSAALRAGMTPIVSYWSSGEMLWMDGQGQDFQGPCARDDPATCGFNVRFYGFAVESIGGSQCHAELTDQKPARPEPERRQDPGPAKAAGGAAPPVPQSGSMVRGAVLLAAALAAAGLALAAGLLFARGRSGWCKPPLVAADEGAGSPTSRHARTIAVPGGLQNARPSAVGLLALAAAEPCHAPSWPEAQQQEVQPQALEEGSLPTQA